MTLQAHQLEGRTGGTARRMVDIVNVPITTLAHYDQSGPTTDDSLNISSITDHAAGRFTLNFTASHAGASTFGGTCENPHSNTRAYVILGDGTHNQGPSAALAAFETATRSSTVQDGVGARVTVRGELA